MYHKVFCLMSSTWTEFFTDGKVFDGDPSLFRKIFKLFIASCLLLGVYEAFFNKNHKSSNKTNSEPNSSEDNSKKGGIKNFLCDTAKTVVALKAYDMFKDWSSSKKESKEKKEQDKSNSKESSHKENIKDNEDDFSYSNPDDFK